jgi:hypothetical protein
MGLSSHPQKAAKCSSDFRYGLIVALTNRSRNSSMSLNRGLPVSSSPTNSIAASVGCVTEQR